MGRGFRSPVVAIVGGVDNTKIYHVEDRGIVWGRDERKVTR